MKNKTKVVSIVLFLSAFILLASCQKQKTEWKGTIKEENGVIVVKNPKVPMYSEDVLSLKEELTLGKTREGKEPVFISISGIEVDSEGNLNVENSSLIQNLSRFRRKLHRQNKSTWPEIHLSDKKTGCRP